MNIITFVHYSRRQHDLDKHHAESREYLVNAIEWAKQKLEAYDSEPDKLLALQKYVYHHGDDGILYELSDDGLKMRRVASYDGDVNEWEDIH